MTDTPAKSSLSEFREKVSYKFFEEIFENDFNRLNPFRKKFKNFYIYAIDGDQYDLPVSDEILGKGYRGWPCKKKRETYYPKMYAVQALDVVNGLVRKFCYSTGQDETHLAREMVQDFEHNSITLYDRLHCGYKAIFAHVEANNYFIIRARDGGDRIQNDIKKFRDSSKRSEEILFYSVNQRLTMPPLCVRLVKIKNPKSGKDLIFMTNLSKDQFLDKEIALLYQRRWEIETSFRDQTSTLKLEQWHSKKLNGILQEIFATLWLANAAKMECLMAQKSVVKKWLDPKYLKSNFKLCVAVIIENLDLLLKETSGFKKILSYWLNRCREKRKHLSRSYPRCVKSRGKAFDTENMVPRRG